MASDPRVDQYISAAPAFAQPMLTLFREVVHTACPQVEESIKWGRPMFLYRNKILYGMAAFKAHCGFLFFQPGVRKLLEKEGLKSDEGSGSLGRVTQMADLPSREDLLRYVREGRRLMDEAAPHTARRERSTGPKPPLAVPDDLAAALAKDNTAAKTFHNFSPSHRREYIEWIIEAKRDETRQQRIATTLEWLREGKTRNWKYVNG
jgi:uncharacterized protein YdeI (YjbR/CyaY-like superfamily)